MALGSPSVFSVRRVVIRRRDTAAFTLIELLVVVAVILILAALVAPLIRNALRSSQKTECYNNLHQIHSTGAAQQKTPARSWRGFPTNQRTQPY